MTTTSTTQRPGVITFIGIVMYIQAFMAAVAAVSLLIWKNDILDFLEREGTALSDGAFTGTVVGEVIAALLLFFVAIVQGLSMVLATYTLIAHHVGSYAYRGVFSLFIGAFVLWALYGNEQSQEYFEGQA